MNKEEYKETSDALISVLSERSVKHSLILISDGGEVLTAALSKGNKENLTNLVSNTILNDKLLAEIFIEAVDYALQVIEKRNEQTKIELARPLLLGETGEC